MINQNAIASALRSIVETSLYTSQPQQFLRSVLPILQSLGFDRIRAYLLSNDEGALVGVHEVGGRLNLPKGKQFTGLRLPVAKNRYVLNTFEKNTIAIYDKTASHHIIGEDSWGEILGKEGISQWIEVPLVRGKRRIGLICLDNKYSNARVDDADIKSIEHIFSFVGTVVGHLKEDLELSETEKLIPLLSGIDNDLVTELKVSTGTPHTITRDILQKICDHIMQLMHPAYVEISLVEASSPKICAYSGPLEHVNLDPTNRETPLADAINTGRESSLLGKGRLERAGSQPGHAITQLPRIRARGAFPLVQDGKATAVILVLSGDWDFLSQSRRVAIRDFLGKVALVLRLRKIFDEYNSNLMELEKKRTEMRDQLEARTRGMLTAEIARGVLHGLGNEISGIALAAARLRDPLRSEPRIFSKKAVVESLSTLDKNIRFIDTILETYRKLTGQQEEQLQGGNIHEVLREAINFCTGRAERKGVRVRSRFSQEIPELRFSYVGMLQVFVNLINNAIEAMEKSKGSGNTLEVTTSLRKGHCVISFRDEGSGVRAEIRKKIFELFFTTRSAEGGTGVGLAIARRIVAEQHRGWLRLRSTTPGKGSTFEVGLPVG